MRPLLNFNAKTQEFSWNEDRLKDIDFREMSVNQLFNKNKSLVILKNAICPDVAKKIQYY